MESINNLLAHLRTDYVSDDIFSGNFSEDPFDSFAKWMKEAVGKGVSIPNAMHLSTVGTNGRPSGRILLLHGMDKRGFIFYTNFESRKGDDLLNCRFASITFFWAELYRQVRIEGEVCSLPEDESDKYFLSRPRESQIAATASLQSRVLESRELLEKRVKEIEDKYKNKSIPRPPYWGGYFLTPYQIEFWQGRAHRLHDRIIYSHENNIWTIRRLYP